MQSDQLFASAMAKLGSVKKLAHGKYARASNLTQCPKANNHTQNTPTSPKTSAISVPADALLTSTTQFHKHQNWQAIAPQTTLSWCCPSAKTRLTQLKSGKLQVAHILDMHGYTLAQAADTLSSAFTRWHHQGNRIIRIIHGKGSREKPSILKAHMPLWLTDHPLVIAYTSDLPANGGTGSLLVLLRKPK